MILLELKNFKLELAREIRRAKNQIIVWVAGLLLVNVVANGVVTHFFR